MIATRMIDLSDIERGLIEALLNLIPFLFYFVLLPALIYAAYFCISLPMRRQERAQFFLDLLETGLQDGRSLEQTVTTLSESRDRALPVRFHLLAAHIENGMSFGQALE